MGGLTWTYRGKLPRVLLEDPGAAHQIRLSASGGPEGRKSTVYLAVNCTCMGRANAPHEPLDARLVFPAEEAQAVWKAHARENGMDV